MNALHEQGARAVIVMRSSEPLLLLDDEGIIDVSRPRFEEKETRGAEDSLTAGVAEGITRGEGIREAIGLGAAAGALNVTRHGLGTGDAESISRLRDRVSVDEFADSVETPTDGSRVSPDVLAALTDVDDAP